MHVGVSEDGKSAAVLGADAGGKTVEGKEVKGSAKVFDVDNFGKSRTPNRRNFRRRLTLLQGTRHDQHSQTPLQPSHVVLAPWSSRCKNTSRYVC